MDTDKHNSSITIASEEEQEKLDEKMHEILLKEKEKQAHIDAESYGVSYINLKGFPIAPEVLSLITKEEAKQLSAVPFFQNEGELRIGAIDPLSEGVRVLGQRLADSQKAHVVPYMISQHSLDIAIKLYDAIPRPRHYVSGVTITEDELDQYRNKITTIEALGQLISQVPFAQLVALMVAGALESRASDIHVEAEADDIKIRFRIDGVLHDISSLHKEVWKQLVNRLKLLSKVKLNIIGNPQDGRFTIFLSKEEIDVRVSFLPTGYGESVVMRILRSSAASLILDDLGLRGPAKAILMEEIKRPNGMLLTTGPTGSGKTTTLYAVLNAINTPDSKIITLENPIEYHLKGVNQSQVDEATGYTFAKGLRSMMRQDPDIVMVGEIRDEETAEISVNAALTGHFVLSTLHTNNAAGAIPRFIAMGVKPYLLAPALNTVIAQRLVRRICSDCKHEAPLSPLLLAKAKEALASISPKSGVKTEELNLKFYEGKGCKSCQGIGYKGRIGIYELFTMSQDIEKLILSAQVSEFEMEKIAVEQGMITMLQDGILKALDGLTTVEEVLKVTG